MKSTFEIIVQCLAWVGNNQLVTKKVEISSKIRVSAIDYMSSINNKYEKGIEKQIVKKVSFVKTSKKNKLLSKFNPQSDYNVFSSSIILVAVNQKFKKKRIKKNLALKEKN